MNTFWTRFIAIFGGCMLLSQPLFADSDSDTIDLVAGFTNKPAASTAPAEIGLNDTLLGSREKLGSTNLLGSVGNHGIATNQSTSADWTKLLEMGRRQRVAHLYNEATPIFVSIILTNAAEPLKRTALLELAIIAQEENQLAKAQQIFAHYISKWPDDPNAPEIMLRQGLIFRQMGLHAMALSKFYAVMTSSLVLEADKLDHYQRMVLQAQTEIADTYYQQGKFGDSVDLYTRLLKNDTPRLNRPQVHFKLIRSLASLHRYDDAAKEAFGFLERYGECPEQPEVRFYLATSLKQLGRNNDSLQQVLTLLQSQKEKAVASPETWGYWQQKTGNEIANQLYKDGDYLRALQLYTGLAALNTNAEWQLPVLYQIGLTFERLEQPMKALEQYKQILARESDANTAGLTPALQTVINMARWRKDYLAWETTTQNSRREGLLALQTNAPPASL